MLGILVVSHGELAAGMKQSCEMIAGTQENLHTLSLTEAGVVAFQEHLQTKILEMENIYNHIVILADLVNATPFLQAGRLINDNPAIRLVAGVNLPTLLAFVLSADSCQSFDNYVESIVLEQAASIVLFRPSSDRDDDEEL